MKFRLTLKSWPSCLQLQLLRWQVSLPSHVYAEAWYNAISSAWKDRKRPRIQFCLKSKCPESSLWARVTNAVWGIVYEEKEMHTTEAIWPWQSSSIGFLWSLSGTGGGRAMLRNPWKRTRRMTIRKVLSCSLSGCTKSTIQKTEEPGMPGHYIGKSSPFSHGKRSEKEQSAS